MTTSTCFYIFAAGLALAAVAHAESANEASYAEATSFVEAFMTEHSTEDKSTSESACSKVANDSIKEIQTQCDSQQSLIVKARNANKICCKSGEAAVCATKQRLKESNRKASECAKIATSLKAQAVKFPDVPFNKLTKGKCDSFFGTAYNKIEEQVATQNKKCVVIAGEIKAFESTLAQETIAASKARNDCNSLAKEALTKAYNDSTKICQSDNNQKSYTRAKHMLCVLAGTTLSKCKTNNPPTVAKGSMAGLECPKLECCPSCFKATLGPKNEVPSQTYEFRAVHTSATSGSYSNAMVSECAKYKMKPVCDHPSYCKNNDNKSLYIGQDHHISHQSHRDSNQYFPSGWNAIRRKWDGLCNYSNKANGNTALCAIPGSHVWKAPSTSSSFKKTFSSFMCGKIVQPSAYEFKADLGAKNGVSAHTYTFRRVRTSEKSGSYSNAMVKECAKHGMKPICEHPSYCKSDNKSLYIGQTHHISHGSHRDTDHYFPSGWNQFKNKWKGLCNYSNKSNGGQALCNSGNTFASHAWKTLTVNDAPTLWKDFMCGRITK